MKSFLQFETPPLVAMIQCSTAEECIKKIKRSISCGAEALGIQLCRLEPKERTHEKLKEIFAACEDKPTYVTSYRCGHSEGLTDAQCVQLLLDALSCGATLCDIPGDFFARNDVQMTTDRAAVAAQCALVDQIHKNGGEVLMSTHDFRELSKEQILEIAKLQAGRNVDILKIIVDSKSDRMLPDYISAIQTVNAELKKPFLLLDRGACSNFLRKTGGVLGCCMYLCVESHGPLDTAAQPNLHALKRIRDNLPEEKIEIEGSI